MAVLTSTASAPSSIASAAWLGAPRPASTTTGTVRLLDDDSNLVARLDSPVGSNRRAQRHHGGGAHFLQAFRQHRIRIDIRQYRESFVHQNLGRGSMFPPGRAADTAGRDGFEFDPFGQSRREPPGGPGAPPPAAFMAPLVFGRSRYLLRINEFQDVGEWIAVLPAQIRAAQRHRHHSVPLASSASRIASGDENFPVPTSKRERNSVRQWLKVGPKSTSAARIKPGGVI